MRGIIHDELIKYFAAYMRKTRKAHKLSQAKMAKRLVMGTRSYVDVENGSNLCSTITFIYFMLYFADDILKTFEEIAVVIENAKK